MVADTPWIKCLIITKLNFGSTVQVGPPLQQSINRLLFLFWPEQLTLRAHDWGQRIFQRLINVDNEKSPTMRKLIQE